MIAKVESLFPNKKIYFASDFHLGSPNASISLERERKIIRWLDAIKPTAQQIFLLGDVFDFWYEYNHVVPKGYIRFFGKLAEIIDSGIPINFFTGNHDLWTFDYFPSEIGMKVYHCPQYVEFCGKKLLIGHGDGLGNGDYGYKILKKIFENRFLQYLFAKIHPDLSFRLAFFWSRSSKNKARNEEEKRFLGEKEWLWQYCKALEVQKHADYYIFGHRHLPLDLEVSANSRYINLGEWFTNQCHYAEFDGNNLTLKTFE
ncbi:MAG: UDP-2,3-diacylglucosamine diphosphatase [Bacteroidetes bacterium]|nr:MAG: UDP-2,3-diacylglucosamine diphosphatase [Bacteroidota bacterium]